jgi:hypothetical protein
MAPRDLFGGIALSSEPTTLSMAKCSFLHLVLAIENTEFSVFSLYMDQTEHTNPHVRLRVSSLPFCSRVRLAPSCRIL